MNRASTNQPNDRLVDLSGYDRLTEVPPDQLNDAIAQTVARTPLTAVPPRSAWLDKQYFTRYGPLFDADHRLNRRENLAPLDDQAFSQSVGQYATFDNYWHQALLSLSRNSSYLRQRDYSSVPIDQLLAPFVFHSGELLVADVTPVGLQQKDRVYEIARRYMTLLRYLTDLFHNLASVINEMSRYLVLSSELDNVEFVDVTPYRRRNRLLLERLDVLSRNIERLNKDYERMNDQYQSKFNEEIMWRRRVVKVLTSLLSGAIFKTGATPRDIVPRTPVDTFIMSRVQNLLELYRTFRRLLDRKRIRQQLMQRITEGRANYTRDTDGSTLLFPYF